MHTLFTRGVLTTACLLALAGCGGGGGGDHHPPTPPEPPEPPASGNFGGKLLSSVARGGVAGTWGYTAPDGSRYGLMGTAKG